MIRKDRTIYVARTSLPLKRIRTRREEMLEKYFTGAERENFRRRPAQSIAGAIALKRALIRLCREAGFDAKFHESSFRLSHSASGAVRVAGCPRLTLSRRRIHFHVSIAHSRMHAHALAALEVNAHA